MSNMKIRKEYREYTFLWKNSSIIRFFDPWFVSKRKFKILSYVFSLFSQYTSRMIVSNQELTLSLEKCSNFDLLESEKNLILYFFIFWTMESRWPHFYHSVNSLDNLFNKYITRLTIPHFVIKWNNSCMKSIFRDLIYFSII